jgi:hypothetical protein
MKEVLETLQSLQNTPVPNLIVIVGFLFLLLAFVGRIGAIIELPRERQRWSGIIGVVLLIIGIGLFLLPNIQPDTTPTDSVLTDVLTTTNYTESHKPSVYDDFNNSAYDGSFDQNLWLQYFGVRDDMVQQDGILDVTKRSNQEGWTELKARNYDHVQIATPTYFEATMKIDPEEGFGSVYLFIFTDDISNGGGWKAMCQISADAYISCFEEAWEMDDATNYSYNSFISPVEYGEWQTLGINFDPSTVTFSYYRNGEMVNSHIPYNAEILKNGVWSLVIGVGGDQVTEYNGYFDEVRIGQVE